MMKIENHETECISIIVPVYKMEKYLPQCIESIIKQTYENLEILLIDDGSPDRCGEICDEYAAKDSRIKVIHQPNKGVSAARNAGLDRATGAYVGFVDADDWIEPDMYEKLHALMKQEGVAITACGCVYYQEGIGRVCQKINKTEMRLAGEELIMRAFQSCRFGGALWNKLFEMKLLQENGIRLDEDIFYTEDFLFTLRCALIAGEAYCSAEPLYHYRIHNTSALRTFNEKILTRMEARRRIIELLSDCGNRVKNLAYGLYSASAADIRANALMHGDNALAKSLLPEIKPYLFLYLKQSMIPLAEKIRILLKYLCPRFSLSIWRRVKGVWQRLVWKKAKIETN